MQSKTTTAKLALAEIVRSKGLPIAVAYPDNDDRTVILVNSEGKVEEGSQKGHELLSLSLVALAQLAEYGTTNADEIEDILG